MEFSRLAVYSHTVQQGTLHPMLSTLTCFYAGLITLALASIPALAQQVHFPDPRRAPSFELVFHFFLFWMGTTHRFRPEIRCGFRSLRAATGRGRGPRLQHAR